MDNTLLSELRREREGRAGAPVASPPAAAPVASPQASKKRSRDVEDAEDPAKQSKREADINGSVEVVVGGDLLRAREGFIAHQANCQSKGARGLAKVLFQAFPNANVYAQRTAHSEPGTIAPRDCDGKMIVALFAQRSPGTPRATGDDSAVTRLRWFERSLDRLGSLMAASGAEAVAMPFNIGCGLAGGRWPAYRKRLDDFASRYAVSVRLYDLDGVSAASLGSKRES